MNCSLPGSLSMGFPREKYWGGKLKNPFPWPRDLPDPGIKATSLALAEAFFTTEPPGKPSFSWQRLTNSVRGSHWSFQRGSLKSQLQMTSYSLTSQSLLRTRGKKITWCCVGIAIYITLCCSLHWKQLFHRFISMFISLTHKIMVCCLHDARTTRWFNQIQSNKQTIYFEGEISPFVCLLAFNCLVFFLTINSTKSIGSSVIPTPILSTPEQKSTVSGSLYGGD